MFTDGASVSQKALTVNLCGVVTFAPANPSASSPRTASSSRSGAVGSATYAQSRPSASNAALCIRGESECSTGQPMIPTSRVVPEISARQQPPNPYSSDFWQNSDWLAVKK